LKARRIAGIDTLLLRELDRGTFSIAREWTDWADPSPYVSLDLPPRRLDADLLFELATLLEQLTIPEQKVAAHIRSGAQMGRVPEGSSGVRKYCLPMSECATLLDLLRKLGIDRAHLMPSFDGVVRELESRRRRHMKGDIPIIGS
jgi:hypothetical protein